MRDECLRCSVRRFPQAEKLNATKMGKKKGLTVYTKALRGALVVAVGLALSAPVAAADSLLDDLNDKSFDFGLSGGSLRDLFGGSSSGFDDDLSDLTDLGDLDDLFDTKAIIRSSGSNGLLPFGRDIDIDRDVRYDQDVDLDEDTILNGIILDRSGVRDVSFNTLRDYDADRRVRYNVDQDTDFDRDDILNFVALGGDCGDLELADIADFDVDIDARVDVDHDIDLDDDDVLLAVAFKNAVGGSLSLFDIADVDHDVRVDLERDSDFDLDRDSVLLALTCG